jgi:hypothetical protein
VLSIPGTLLVTRKEVLLREEPKDGGQTWWFYGSITLPPLTPLLLLEIKHNPEPKRFGRAKNRPQPGSKAQKILRFLYDNKRYSCEMSNGQINKFFALFNKYEKIKKAIEYNEKQQKNSKKQNK